MVFEYFIFLNINPTIEFHVYGILIQNVKDLIGQGNITFFTITKRKINADIFNQT